MYSHTERKLVSILLVLLLCGLAVVVLSPKLHFPDAGIWYCDELQMQISFEDDTASAVVDGKKIPCIWETDGEEKRISVRCSEDGYPGYAAGASLFTAKITRLEDNTLVVYEESSGNTYTFLKIG